MARHNLINALRALYGNRPSRQFDIELPSRARLRAAHRAALGFMEQRAILPSTGGLSHHLDGQWAARHSVADQGRSPLAPGKGNGHAD